MWVFFCFVSKIYLKNFFIVFFALLGFYCSVDLLLNFKDLPKTANLDLLYIMFLAFSAVPYVLPLCLVFALVLSLISMIKNNELVSFYALGISKNYVILYPFLWALFFCFVYIGLNFTSFAYANDYKRNILKNGTLVKQSGEVFLKFNDDFIYIPSLDNENKIQNLKIFSVNDYELNSFSSVSNAYFKDESWILNDVNISKILKNYKLGDKALNLENFSTLTALSGFKPKIIESVATNSSYSIYDALISLRLFSSQNINLNTIKISLYKLIFTPFFAPFLMLIMYYFFPVISRFFNLALVSFTAFVVTLMLWGILFLLTRLSENNVILSEFGIILPILFLASFGIFMFYKYK